MPSVEDMLLLAAQQKAAENQTASLAPVIGGAALGGLAGATIGSVPHHTGRLLNKMQGHQPNRFRPGMRMAGGLVGAMGAAALGSAAQQALLGGNAQENEAARLLAKAQVGQLSDADMYAMENILTDGYSKLGVI